MSIKARRRCLGSHTSAARSITGGARLIIEERLHKEDFLREQTDLPLLVRTDTQKFLREADLKRGGRDDLYYFWDERANALRAAPRKSLALGDTGPAVAGSSRV